MNMNVSVVILWIIIVTLLMFGLWLLIEHTKGQRRKDLFAIPEDEWKELFEQNLNNMKGVVPPPVDEEDDLPSDWRNWGSKT